MKNIYLGVDCILGTFYLLVYISPHTHSLKNKKLYLYYLSLINFRKQLVYTDIQKFIQHTGYKERKTKVIFKYFYYGV